MRSSQNFSHKRIVLLCLSMLLLIVGRVEAQKIVSHRAKSLESRADAFFIRKDFDRAMLKYEHANSKLPVSDQKKCLRLKMARLYMLLQNHSSSVSHYEWVMQQADSMLTVDDVCNVMDAYRRMDKSQEAELISRRYAFRSPYSRSQRYMNSVYALSTQRHYYARGFSEYIVKYLPINTQQDEYWVGSYNGELLYSGTKSDMHDLKKVSYHRSKYYSLKDGKVQPFDFIPLPLQNGPVAFNEDGSQVVVTKTSYNEDNDKITEPGESFGIFVTELLVSNYDKKRGRWSEFMPLYPQNISQSVNYAHPFYIAGGGALLFSSDRPGGFGGMDIYIAYWNKELNQWSEPHNMGDQVNTEGDEIHPSLHGNVLSFSSNGHEGFGGYDIFDITYVNDKILRGSLAHLSYPVNSVYNDFAMYRVDEMQGYFVSDRNNEGTFDDIYAFSSVNTPLGLTNIVGIYDEDAALKGVLNVIKEMDHELIEIKRENVSVADVGFKGPLPESGSVIMTIYFDFNSDRIGAEDKLQLDALIASDWFADVDGFELIGYADELGTDVYNKRLSERRAKSVVGYLRANSTKTPKMLPEGKGRLILSPEQQWRELLKSNGAPAFVGGQNAEIKGNYSLTFEQRKLANGPARKVDVVVHTK